MALGIDVEHVVRYLIDGAPDRVQWSVTVDRGELSVHGYAPLRAGRLALRLGDLAGTEGAAAVLSARSQVQGAAQWLVANALDDDMGEGYALRFRAGPFAERGSMVH